MGNRPWPEADDNELIGYKLDTRSRNEAEDWTFSNIGKGFCSFA